MSSRSTGADESGAEERPSREVAYRLFAAEFDDASFSYSESDEERAPNYVVTPTGARINRLFAVGVLTEVERVNDDVLRGRVVDPTGAFVSYAGQYQPDEMAFLDRASPPAFVALSGKARTFQPDDSDRVFTSVRPESLSRVDADTRDRWTVSAAEATLDRVGVAAAALRSGLAGEQLRAALDGAGVDPSLAAGVPLALDRYGTTPAYLAAVRRLAVDALEVVAGDRDSVRSLDVAPAEAGDGVDLDALAADLDLARAAPAAASTTGAETSADTTGTGGDAPAGADADAAATEREAEEVPSFDDSAAAASTGTGSERRTGAEPETETAATPSESASGSGSASESASGSVSDATTAAADRSEAADAGAEPSGSATSESVDESRSGATAGPAGVDSGQSDPDAAGASTEPAADDLGDFDAGEPGAGAGAGGTDADEADEPTAEGEGELGDFAAGGSSGPGEPTAAGSAGDADEADDLVDESDDLYELDAEEREAIESEYGTEFSTGSEVGPAGEADIDVPSVEELEEELDEDRGAGSQPAGATAPDRSVADDADGTADAPTDEAGETADADAGAETADVDLEAAAVEAMATLDDGDGASREAVVAAVVDEYGADPGEVEDAIQSALMSGQCYEPTEDSLKAI